LSVCGSGRRNLWRAAAGPVAEQAAAVSVRIALSVW
jgi:hypothetical protein